MPVSAFDLFKIGIGPSSSHTVGPMRAARRFLLELEERGLLAQVSTLKIWLYGSLALTGKGHATDYAILLGLCGSTPDGVNVDEIEAIITEVRESAAISLLGKRSINFVEAKHLVFCTTESLPQHPNGMRFAAFDGHEHELYQRVFFSIGGGFVVANDEVDSPRSQSLPMPYKFRSADELLRIARAERKTIAQIAYENELALRSPDQVLAGLSAIWTAMQDCIKRGLRKEGLLPGRLRVRRRAKEIYERLIRGGDENKPLHELDWVNVYGLAVNEENAAGGRVVTAPTNGAAGIVPAVMMYFQQFCPGADTAGMHTFLLTAGAIGSLYKENASISGAEVGCQGEVGAACSMAAGGLTAALGGSNEQVENAAEIGMEHNLGLTCDPVGGLVQIPCIERNAMGAVKSINAAHLALSGDGRHYVSLDKVIETMRQTGVDMQSKYKETSRGGLAVNVIAC
jgi:L-serine dehydratase